MFRPGTQIGSYEIVTSIGGRGQSEVYRARDTQRGVEVMLRPLPEPLATMQDAVERIEQESRLLETLNHPNIATIHAVEDAGGARFLVADFANGETLAERLRRGALSVGDALAVALGIARALEAAHDNGVFHRDLNPSNVRVGPDGNIRVFDFGLASVFTSEVAASDIALSQSPTRSVSAAQSGSFSGTAAYMSPEQVRGEVGDAKSDVWALGCIFYEMLAGRPAFAGQSESEVRAAILKSEPDWSRLPAHLPARIRFLLERCLEKRSAYRSSDMAGVRADIEKALEDPADAPAASTGPKKHRALPWVAALILAGVLGFGASWSLRSDTPATEVVRFNMWASNPGGVVQFLQAISPELEISSDGSRIAFRGVDGGLYIRDRADITPRPLRITGQTGVLYSPLFSPDGRDLFYVDVPVDSSVPTAAVMVLPRGVANQIPAPGLNLNKVPVDGGAPTPVLTGRNEELLDATWSPDGKILFVNLQGKIQTISANGGTPTTLTEAPGARYPQLLPDGKRILYSTGDLVAATTGRAAPTSGQIVVQALNNPEDRQVIWEGGTHARYVQKTGHIVYQGMTKPGLWAFTFDLSSLKKTGDPVPLVEGTIVDYGISDTGSLAYAVAAGLTLPSVNGDNGASILGLVGTNGGVNRRLRVDPGGYRNPRFSPDGKRVVYESVNAGGESTLWVYDFEGDSPRKLTLDGQNIYPIWKDDAHVTFAAKRDGVWGVYSQATDPGAAPELLVAAPQGTVYRPQAWSPATGPANSDRTLVLVIASDGADDRTGHLAMWTSGSEVAEIAPARAGANEISASLSSDGKWLAYISDCEAFLGCSRVQRFPPVPGSSFQIRQNDGWVQFFPNTQQLLTSRNGAVFVWSVTSAGDRIDFGGPGTWGLLGMVVARDNRSFDVRMAQGPELVMVIPANQPVAPQGEQNPTDSVSSQIDLIHNFFEVLQERVRPAGNR